MDENAGQTRGSGANPLDNRHGIILMSLAMAGFALEDTFIKLSSATLPVGQILAILGLGGAAFFGLLCWRQGKNPISRDFLLPSVILRNAGEVVAGAGFVTALALTPLASASAILQATPLAVTAGAAVFLDERVGWRRWSAIAVGFTGVLLVVRPGLEGFQPASLFAVMAVVALAARDVATRVIPKRVATAQLSAWAFAVMVPTGLAMMLAGRDAGISPDPVTWIWLLGAVCFGPAGYYAITAAMRVGEISVVTPFRYLRLVFALVIGAIVFGERPDLWTLAGATVIIGTGLYTLSREARSRRSVPERHAAPTASIPRAGR